MKRLGLTLLVLTVISVTTYYVFTHENIARAEKIEQEVNELRRQNRALEAENQRMARTVVALRDDPRLAERKARANSRLARPDEVIFQFGQPEETLEVSVRLTVSPDALRLAGKTILIDQLAQGLETLHSDIPSAKLQVEFDPNVDPLREQRVRDLVEASVLAPAEFIKADQD